MLQQQGARLLFLSWLRCLRYRFLFLSGLVLWSVSVCLSLYSQSFRFGIFTKSTAEQQTRSLRSLAIFVPAVYWHHECWGFALQFAVDAGYKIVHLHIKSKGRHYDWHNATIMWTQWRGWLDFYKSNGLFLGHFEVKIDADFNPLDYSFVIVPTAQEHWLVPSSWGRLLQASEWMRIARFAKQSMWTLARTVADWRPVNTLFLDHTAESPAFTWNHIKIRLFHRTHILSCFRVPAASRQHQVGSMIVVARGGEESILRHVAKLPNVSLRIVCEECDYKIPEAELIDTHAEIMAETIRSSDIYLVARSGSYTRGRLNGAIPIAVSFLVPVVLPYEMAFDMGYDGNKFLTSYANLQELEYALYHAREVNSSEYEIFRNRNVEQNNKLIESHAVDFNDDTRLLWEQPMLKTWEGE